MKRHPTKVNGQSVLDAAKEVGKLRYDKLGEFLDELAKEMARQAEADHAKGRVELAYDAEDLIMALYESSNWSHMLFEKYKKYMDDELDQD